MFAEPNFENMNRATGKQMSAWKLLVILLIVNIAGFTIASIYFSRETGNSKPETQATQNKAEFGARVKHASSLAEWGYQVLLIIRGKR